MMGLVVMETTKIYDFDSGSVRGHSIADEGWSVVCVCITPSGPRRGLRDINKRHLQYNTRVMIKKALRNMANQLLFILRETKDWNQAKTTIPNDINQELGFTLAVIDRSSTPRGHTNETKKRKSPNETEFQNEYRIPSPTHLEKSYRQGEAYGTTSNPSR